MPYNALLTALTSGLSGFLAGLLVNLLADYLPAQRHFILARRSPFTTVKPARPSFLPRREDGRLWPLWRWPALTAMLFPAPQAVRMPAHHGRHLAVELGLAAAFALISLAYGTMPFWPFYLLYVAVFTLVMVMDIEHRWILPEVTWIASAVALLEAATVQRLPLDEALRGGLRGGAITLALYLGGLAFTVLVQALGRRRISRTVFGLGDIRLGVLGGLILGSGAIGPALLLTLFAGGAGALVLMLGQRLRRGRYRRFSALPYGPYMVFGLALTLYMPGVTFDLLRTLIFALRGAG